MKFPTHTDVLVSAQERDATVLRRPSKEQIERLRKRYPAGTRIELIEMSDSQAPPPGTLGTCIAIDDMGDLIMRWDNGSGLNLIPKVDNFRIVKEAHHE